MPSGGNHGGGRPPGYKHQTKEQEKYARLLKEKVNVTLEELGPRWRELTRRAMDLAMEGDRTLLKMFVELPFKYMETAESPETGLDLIRENLVKTGVLSFGEQPREAD